MSARVLLITAGPSRESFDDIRFLTNAASGALGLALARRAVAHGYETHLALGPTSLAPPEGVTVHRFTSAEDLDAICARLWPRVEVFIATAAVCDFRPEERIPGKRKKGAAGEEWTPRLVRTPDVLARRSEEKGDRVLVGFSLESGRGPDEARRKLVKKNLDLILWNDPTNLGASDGRYVWIEPGGVEAGAMDRDLGLLPKEAVAEEILRFVDRRIGDRRPEGRTGGSRTGGEERA